MPGGIRGTFSDQRSFSETSNGSRTDTSDKTETSINSYVDSELETPLYPELDNLKLVTAFPGSLSYRQLLIHTLPNVPHLLIQLVDRIDKEVPPLQKLCFGVSNASLADCDRVLTTLAATKNDSQLCAQIIESCTPSQVAQLIQLFFLRLENPPFVATSNFCDAICQKGYFLHPRTQVRKDVASSLTRITKECLSTLNVYQQATLSYFIERCQRWCHSEVAYTMHCDPAANATTTYSEAIRFLSRLFADCVVGLPKSYVAARIMTGNCEPLTEIKRDVFMLLTATIGSHIWHKNSIDTLYVPRELLPPITIMNPQTKSDPIIPKTHTLLKIRSFNWL